MIVFLRWRSTNVPNTMPRNADEALNAPPIIAVVTTERVSRYTQNVTANQRNVLVTPLSSELIRSLRNVGTGASQTFRSDGCGAPASGVRLQAGALRFKSTASA